LSLSPATVSRVLNNRSNVDAETRQRVLDCINELGYFPTMGRRISNVIALAYPDEPVRTEYGSFEPTLLSGIMRGLEVEQFDLKLLSIRRDKRPDETYTQFFMRKGVRGVLLRCFRHSRPMILEIAAEKFPAVVIAEHFDEPAVNYIRAESYSSSRRAVEHLITLGHRSIALAIHSVSDSDHAERRRAYADALHCAGITVDPSLIFELPASLSSGEQVLDAIADRRGGGAGTATAVFATNPMTSLGIMRRAQERGISIPGELSVVGVDDGDVRMHVWPRLTAVCQDASSLGYEATVWLTRGLGKTAMATSSVYRRTTGTVFEVNGTTSVPARLPTAARGGASVPKSASIEFVQPPVARSPAEAASGEAVPRRRSRRE
jgi:DNA-binding LacI/PurR family transcriptional regulator